MKVIVRNNELKMYWLSPGEGMTDDMNEAFVYTEDSVYLNESIYHLDRFDLTLINVTDMEKFK